MASEVDICNLALANLGNSATVSAITPPDGSVEAMHCARFYPIARDALVAMHAWGFATRRVSLALISTDELPNNWAFAYAAPNSCARPLKVLQPGYTDESGSEDYVYETLQTGERVIYTNVEDAECQYIHKTTDTTKFDALVVTALARLLTSYLAGPLLKGDHGMKVSQDHLKWFMQVDYPLAAGRDAATTKSSKYADYTPADIAARA